VVVDFLLRNPGRVFSRAYLLDAVWGEHYVAGDRSVDNAILRLRRKLGALGEAIETVWGVGYRLVATQQSADRQGRDEKA
jgi:DNA-binding response OmpR family regulator